MNDNPTPQKVYMCPMADPETHFNLHDMVRIMSHLQALGVSNEKILDLLYALGAEDDGNGQ